MRKCQITGKGRQHGHNVSFSLRRTSKTWKPNLHKKTLFIDGKKVKLKISAHGLRILKKNNRLTVPPAKKRFKKVIK